MRGKYDLGDFVEEQFQTRSRKRKWGEQNWVLMKDQWSLDSEKWNACLVYWYGELRQGKYNAAEVDVPMESDEEEDKGREEEAQGPGAEAVLRPVHDHYGSRVQFAQDR